jgi:hypothetical protein
MKNALFWDVTLCDCFKNGRFGGRYRLHHQVTRIGRLGTMLAVTCNQSKLRRNTALYCTILYYIIIFLRSVLPLLVIANIFHSSFIPVPLMTEAIRSNETRLLQEPNDVKSQKTHSLSSVFYRSSYNNIKTAIYIFIPSTVD